MKIRTPVLPLAIFGCVMLLAPRRAHADDWSLDLTPLLAVGASWCAAPGLAAWGVYTGVHNVHGIRIGLRPETGQLAAGYALGGLQLANGVLNLTYNRELFSGGGGETLRGVAIGIGVFGLAMAAFNLTTTIWAHVQPAQHVGKKRFSLSPVVGPEPGGRAQIGLLGSLTF